MLNKKIFIIFLIFSGFLIFCFSCQAILISQVNFIDFSMEKASFAAGEEIKGNFTLKNYEKEVVPDITYSHRLLAEDSDGFFTIILDEKFSGDNFSLRSGQAIIKSFNYKLPQNLPSGNHKFRIQVFNSKGISVSRNDVDIIVKSDDRFLTLENNFFLKDGQKLLPKGEAVYDAGQAPQIVFDVSNNSSFQISAFPKIAFYYYDITEKPLQIIEKPVIVLEPGETQSKTFDLLGFTDPGFYLCRLVMHEKNNIISNSTDFHWVISGREVEVIQFRISRSSYQPGDEALVVVYLANIAGQPTEEKGELQVMIFDEQDRLVGEKKEEISLAGGKTEIIVPVTKDVVNPRVELTVFSKEREILDRYGAQVRDEDIIDDVIEEEILVERQGSLLIIAIMLILIIVFAAYFLKKRFSAVKAFFIVLIFSGIFLSANSVLAATTQDSGPGETVQYNWEDPKPPPDEGYPGDGVFYYAGGHVQFQGRIELHTKKNIQQGKIEFFVGSNEDVTPKDYDTGTNIIKIIDEDKSNIIKLGEYYPPTSNVLAYNQTFQIPENVAYVGSEGARFYIQFSGLSNKWHWLIAYEEAVIQDYKEGGFFLELEADKKEVSRGDEITWTVRANNQLPCIKHDLDVIMVIDVSGSMGEDMEGKTRLFFAKEAAKAFVNAMGKGSDQIGLVSYAAPPAGLRHVLTFNHDDVIGEINILSASGGTCTSCGINEANEEMASERKRPYALPYHVLMTDGVPTLKMDGTGPGNEYCDDCAKEAEEQAEDSRDMGIKIYTIGFAIDPTIDEGKLAEDHMKEIADITTGQYFHAPTGDKLKEVYETIAGIILGESPETKLKINIPDSLEFTDYDNERCYIDAAENQLICDLQDLECGGKTEVPPITFKTKVASDAQSGEIEVAVTISNGADKEKTEKEIIQVLSLPSAEIIFPAANEWQKENFNAVFKYTDFGGPGLAFCEYRVERRRDKATEWPEQMITTMEPWTAFSKTSWGCGRDAKRRRDAIDFQRDPYNTWYRKSRAQFIILKSELNELGFYGGEITAFHLQAFETPGSHFLDLMIRLKHTDKAGVIGWEGNWTDCFGPKMISSVNLVPEQWKKYPCDTLFIWNGEDNLMIDIYSHGSSIASDGGMYRRMDVSPNRMIAGRCDFCELDLYSKGILWGANYSFAPAIKISATTEWLEAGTCSGHEVNKTIEIGVGADEDSCSYQGEEACRISVRAINQDGRKSVEEGDWQRIYHVDWTRPKVEIE